MEEIATAENILCGVGAKAKMCTCPPGGGFDDKTKTFAYVAVVV